MWGIVKGDMIIEFKFQNFLSYKDETRLLMTRVNSFKEFEENHIYTSQKRIELLKSAAIFGTNGGGKSNFITAFQSMMYVVHNSFADSLKKESEREERRWQFRLNTETEFANTMFEVSFLVDKTIYRYGFEVNGYAIKKEWLYRKVDREVMLFERKECEFSINKESFKEGENHRRDVNDNVLLLSHLAQHNQPVSKEVVGCFNKCNLLTGLHEEQYKSVTARLLQKDAGFKKWLRKALNYLEITDVEVGEEKGEIFTYHNRYDGNQLLVDSVRFPLDLMESAGTKKLVYFLGPVYDTLKNGKILFVDEFDTKFHPNLSWKLVALFHESNRFSAQLVFSAQDVSLMNKDLLRRDQIWFANKNQFGESELYSMSEFNSNTVRSTSAYDKKYLNNDFGAAETMHLTVEDMGIDYGG